MTHFVYGMTAAQLDLPFSQYVKIGRALDVARRLGDHQIGSPVPLRMAVIIRLKARNTAVALETHLHRRFRDRWVRGEWFNCGLGDLLDEATCYLGERVFSVTTDGSIPPEPHWLPWPGRDRGKLEHQVREKQGGAG